MSGATVERAPNGEGRLVAIDPDAPWAGWPRPEGVAVTAGQIEFAVDDVQMPSGGPRLVVGVRGREATVDAPARAGAVAGYPTAGAMVDLSTRVGFPWDFVQKLPLALQRDVLNARISEARDTPFTLTRQPMLGAGEDGALRPRPEGYMTVTNVAPGWRSFLPHGDVAQSAWNIMRDVYGDGAAVSRAEVTDQGMRLRVQTDYTEEVRPGGRAVGDVLSLGIEVWHRYGVELGAAAYIERLVCLNGMKASKAEFEWKVSLGGDPQRQLDWLYMGVANAVAAFDSVVDKARQMAAARLEGDMERLLVERARAMRVPRAHEEALLSAWRLEPDPTEWGMLNAFTRFATHDAGLNERQRDQLQSAAGRWTEGFDLIHARLPRPIAEAVGATIYTEDEVREMVR